MKEWGGRLGDLLHVHCSFPECVKSRVTGKQPLQK